jgi:diguanylate cyclase (GGDEF)-like protein/PAS domain S-box-containing protein
VNVPTWLMVNPHFPDEIFRSMVDATTDFIGTVDRNGDLLYLNPAGRAMLEIPSDENIVGHSVLPYNEGAPEEILKAARVALKTGTTTRVSIFVSRSGRRLTVSQTFIVHETSVGTMYSTIARDISDRIAVEQALQVRADHDPLTGLLNRAAFRRTIAESTPTELTCLAMIDLDGFKQVNDSLGHHEGDALLIAVGRALTAALPGGSVIARLGGDEFVVVSAPDPSESIRVALHSVLAPYAAGVSIGVVPLGPEVALDIALREADAQLYANKRLRANQQAFQSQ